MRIRLTSLRFKCAGSFHRYVEYKLNRLEHIYRRVLMVTVTSERFKDGNYSSKIIVKLPKKDVITSAVKGGTLVEVFDGALKNVTRKLREFKNILNGRGADKRKNIRAI